MKKNRLDYTKIRTLEDLHRHKRILEKKMSLRKRLMSKHTKDFSEDFSGNYVYRQSLKLLKLQGPVYSFIPNLVKNIKFNKKFFVPLLAGVGAALSSWAVIKFTSRNNSKQDDKSKYYNNDDRYFDELF